MLTGQVMLVLVLCMMCDVCWTGVFAVLAGAVRAAVQEGSVDGLEVQGAATQAKTQVLSRQGGPAAELNTEAN